MALFGRKKRAQPDVVGKLIDDLKGPAAAKAAAELRELRSNSTDPAQTKRIAQALLEHQKEVVADKPKLEPPLPESAPATTSEPEPEPPSVPSPPGDLPAGSTTTWELDLADGGDTGSTYGPVLWGDLLFCVTGNNLHAVDLSGTLRWTYSPGWGNNQDLPSVAEGLVVAHTLNDTVRAVDAASGELMWEAKSPIGRISHPIAFDGRWVCVADDAGGLCCLDPRDGSTLWTFEHDTRIPTPAIANGRVFATSYQRIGGGGGAVMALDVDTGALLWTADVRSAGNRPVAVDHEVICAGGDGLIGLDAGDGSVRWNAEIYVSMLSPPAVSDGDVFVRTGNHGVCCVARGTGERRWSMNLELDTQDFTFTPPSVCESLILCGLGDGRLHALDAATGEERWSRKVELTPPPVSRDGILYFLDYRRLHAVELATMGTEEPAPEPAPEEAAAGAVATGPRCAICGIGLSGVPAVRDNVTGKLYCFEHREHVLD